MVKLVDPYKKFNSDCEFSHGINKNKIDGLSIFKLTFQSLNDKNENNNDSIQIKNFLTNIKKSILERLNNI